MKLKTLFCSLGLTICSLGLFAQDGQIGWFNFQWDDVTLGSRKVEKAGIMVPFEIEGVPHKFNAQFDLGAVSTMLYGNAIAPYLAKYKDTFSRIDTLQYCTLEGVRCPYFKALNLNLSGVRYPDIDMAWFKGYGDTLTMDSIYTPTEKHVGTFAADLCSDRILVIDFPKQRICILDTLPVAWTDRVNYVPMEYWKENNWIFLPLKVNGKEEKVLFDTGSSIFPLLSSPKNVAKIADMSHCLDSLALSSWGEVSNVYSYQTNVKIELDKMDLSSHPVFIGDQISDEVLEEAGFWGIIGNRYFLDQTVVIDYKNSKFGILNLK